MTIGKQLARSRVVFGALEGLSAKRNIHVPRELISKLSSRLRKTPSILNMCERYITFCVKIIVSPQLRENLNTTEPTLPLGLPIVLLYPSVVYKSVQFFLCMRWCYCLGTTRSTHCVRQDGSASERAEAARYRYGISTSRARSPH
jgi:hypothetical protein